MATDVCRKSGIHVRTRTVLQRVALAGLVVAASSCSGFDLGLGLDFSGFGGGECNSANCAPGASVSPNYLAMLRGDTVRVAACALSAGCGVAGDTGTVLSRWVLADSNVAVFATEPATAIADSVTSVLVRAVGVGQTQLSVRFLATNATQFPAIFVADSSVIAGIDLISYVQQPNQLHVGTTLSFTARLKDSAGRPYRGRPTEMTVSDAATAELTISTDVDGGAKMTLRGLHEGDVDLVVTFLGVSRTVKVTVQP